MSRYFVLLTLPLLWLSCGSKSDEPCVTDACFKTFCDSLVEDMLRFHPDWAASQGRYEYAGQLVIPNAERRAEEVAFCDKWLDSLRTFNPDSLSIESRVDWILIENRLESSKWYITEFKSHEWDPSGYNVAGSIDLLLTGSFAPLNERLEILSKKLEHIPDYYTAAKENIADATQEHTALAIKQNSKAPEFLQTIVDSAQAAGWSGPKLEKLDSLVAGASRAVTGYVDWLKTDILPNAKRGFRIGPELFAKKFELDLMGSYTPDALYQRALDEKDEIHTEMLRITQELWPVYFGERLENVTLQSVKTLIGEISKQHVHRDSFLVAIENQLKDLEAFVRENDLLYLDPAKPLIVRPTPKYARGVAGAGIDAPGPFEKGRNTYYNVTPLDEMSDEAAESMLREYNHYQLQILNIHEAIPGHYTQLVYSNNSPSLIKSLFGNGTMVEGWACYTEKMMLEEGYGHDVPEMWLIYYKWRLRILCNTLLDIGLHTKNLTEEDARRMLIEEAFQEQAQVDEKINRAKVTSVQLCSYYMGLTEIYDLREECRSLQGDSFSLKAWHEKFLSYGSAPVKLIRELMLSELGQPL